MAFPSLYESSAIGMSIVGIFAAFWNWARRTGSQTTRINAIEHTISGLATNESVTALSDRLVTLEETVKQASTTMTEVRVFATKLEGLDRLVTRELDEIKHSLRRIEDSKSK